MRWNEVDQARVWITMEAYGACIGKCGTFMVGKLFVAERPDVAPAPALCGAVSQLSGS